MIRASSSIVYSMSSELNLRCAEDHKFVAGEFGKRLMPLFMLFVHEQEGELTGYSEFGIDRIVLAFKKLMENVYAMKFDFSNHTLRRTFGRRQWKLGTPIETIAEMLGHESIDMTRRYLGLNLTDQERPMKAQDRFVESVVQNSRQAGNSAVSQMKWWAQRDLDS